MWNKSIALFLLLALLCGVGGAHAEGQASEGLTERPARTSGRDVKIPNALVRRLEDEYRTFLTKSEAADKVSIKRQMLNMSAELRQSHSSALHENVRLVTPLGGGVIDLSEIVTPLKGSFFLKIIAKQEDGADPAALRLFFVSHAKKRTLEGEEYGAGCDEMMDITNFYARKNAKDGFELYSTGQRYLSVIGGTFVAVAFGKDALRVGSLTFTDSRYPTLLCETDGES